MANGLVVTTDLTLGGRVCPSRERAPRDVGACFLLGARIKIYKNNGKEYFPVLGFVTRPTGEA